MRLFICALGVVVACVFPAGAQGLPPRSGVDIEDKNALAKYLDTKYQAIRAALDQPDHAAKQLDAARAGFPFFASQIESAREFLDRVVTSSKAQTTKTRARIVNRRPTANDLYVR
jgi:hypothetical protein